MEFISEIQPSNSLGGPLLAPERVKTGSIATRNADIELRNPDVNCKPAAYGNLRQFGDAPGYRGVERTKY